MKVRTYATANYEKVKEYHTDRIELLGDEPLTESDVKGLTQGDFMPMFNFQYYNERDAREEWIAIPCQFIISITND